jgi:hypothetical protein
MDHAHVFQATLFGRLSLIDKLKRFSPLMVTLFFSFCFFLWLMGVESLDPFKFTLFEGGDVAQHFIGWFFFLNEKWMFPIGNLPNLIYPVGSSLAYSDSFPLFALVGKIFSFHSEQLFQITGYWFLLNYCLIGLFGYLILYFIGFTPWQASLGSLFFPLSPALAFRFGHPTLCAHWMVVGALVPFFALGSKVPLAKRFDLTFGYILVFLAAGSHPYLTAMVLFMVLSFALYRTLVREQDQNKFTKLFFHATGLVFVALFTFWIFGYFQGGTMGDVGLGFYNTDLLTFFNSQNKSKWIPGYDYLSHSDGAYEGFGWLGMGLILLLAIGLFQSLIHRAGGLCIKSIIQRRWVILTCLCLFLFAAATRYQVFGHVILKVPLPPMFEKIASAFRSSGRFIWPLYYLIMIGILACFFRFFKPKSLFITLGIVCFALGIQIQDNMALYDRIRKVDGAYYSPVSFTSPLWSNLRPFFKRLDLIPPSLPVGCPPYVTNEYYYHHQYYVGFAFLAAKQKLGINSGSRPRIDTVAMSQGCTKDISDFIEGHVDPEVIYVVDKKFYESYGDKFSKSLTCGLVDSLNVCVKSPSHQSIAQYLQ